MEYKKTDFLIDDIYLKKEFHRVKKNVYKVKHAEGFLNNLGLADWWIRTLKQQNGQCGYCETSIRLIEECISQGLVRGRPTRGSGIRGQFLEIEKVDHAQGYNPDNCLLICYYCNNDKSNVFTKEDYVNFHAKAKKDHFKFLSSKLKSA